MKVPGTVIRWRDPVYAALNRGNYKALRPTLILAIMWQESGGNQWAWNPEPAYRWYWNVKTTAPFRRLTPEEVARKVPPSDFPCFAGDPDQEWNAQGVSWGLMQLMGAAAREQGFKGNYLTELCDPLINLEFGIKHLWNYAYQFGNRSTDQALLRWNGGGDPGYPGKVLAKLGDIENLAD